MVRSLGWPYPCQEDAWPAIAEKYHALAAMHPEFEVMAELVDSVITSGRTHDLAAFTSMHDLVVVPRPVPEVPYDTIFVQLVMPGGEYVQIEHRAVTGRNDKIARPASQAVGLFWRFMIEKYGIASTGEPQAETD